MVILRRIFRKWGGGHELDLYGSDYRQVAGSCAYGNEPSGSIKCGKFLNYLRKLVRKDSALELVITLQVCFMLES
jgi:hypothetical protein